MEQGRISPEDAFNGFPYSGHKVPCQDLQCGAQLEVAVKAWERSGCPKH